MTPVSHAGAMKIRSDCLVGRTFMLTSRIARSSALIQWDYALTPPAQILRPFEHPRVENLTQLTGYMDQGAIRPTGPMDLTGEP